MAKKLKIKDYLKALKLIKSDSKLKERFDKNRDRVLDPDELEKGAAILGRELQAESENESKNLKSSDNNRVFQQKETADAPAELPKGSRSSKHFILIIAFLGFFAWCLTMGSMYPLFLGFGFMLVYVSLDGILTGEVSDIRWIGQTPLSKQRYPISYWIAIICWGIFGAVVIWATVRMMTAPIKFISI